MKAISPAVSLLSLQFEAVRTASYTTGATGVTCTLYRVSGREGDTVEGYAIGMYADGCHYVYTLEGNAARVHDIFSCVVRNTVSPCTLGDVLEDMRKGFV